MKEFMMIQIYVVLILLFMSLFMNVLMFLLYRKHKKTKANPNQTIELQDFLSDVMTHGVGMVQVTRVNPSNIFYHNIKGE